MAKKWTDLMAGLPEERRAKIAQKTEELVREMPLAELRNARHLTQEHLARMLRKDQSAISKIERRTDMYVSTLADFVRAMGGDLEIRAVFPDGVVHISQFGSIDSGNI